MTTVTAGTELSALRIGRITASRMAGVLEHDLKRSPDDVLREMVREHHGFSPDFTGNWFTEYGKEHEADALAQYEEDTGNTVRNTGPDQVTVVHPEVDFLAATPDAFVVVPGESEPSGIGEFKAPPKAQYVHIGDRIDYGDQVQTQLACTGFDWCDFGVWRPNRLDVSTVLADPFWLERHLPALEAFHARYLEVIADPELSAPYLRPLVDVRVDEPWLRAVEEYLDLDAAMKAIEEQKAAAKVRLVELAGDAEKVRGGGLLLYRGKGRAGNVDWKKLLAEHAPDVDPEDYRGARSAPSWTVKPGGEK